MSRRALRPLLALALLPSAAGCFSTVAAPGPAPPDALEGRERFAHDAWAGVLARVVDDGRTRYADYDWTLNDQAGPLGDGAERP